MPDKLIYFDGRGRGERIRYLYAVAGAEFEDYRYPTTYGVPGDRSTRQRPEFDAAKASGEHDINMGKLPILQVDDLKIPQSKAIERYVAKKYGMMGSTEEEYAFIDGICEHARDIGEGQRAARRDDKMDEYLDKLATSLALVDKAVSEKPGPFLVGEKPTLADVTFYCFLKEGFSDNQDKITAALDGAPKIKAALDAFADLDNVKKWQATRP